MTLHQIESTIATAAEDKLVEARQRGVKYSPKDTGLLGSRALKRQCFLADSDAFHFLAGGKCRQKYFLA